MLGSPVFGRCFSGPHFFGPHVLAKRFGPCEAFSKSGRVISHHARSEHGHTKIRSKFQITLLFPKVLDRVLILAIFGDHTIESKTAVIEHVCVTERDRGALYDFWNKSNVAPNRECKKRDLSSYIKAAMCVCVFSPVCESVLCVCVGHSGILLHTRSSKH